MKSAITAICLLIPLVILFILIDRKDFHSGDDVVVQQETVTGRNRPRPRWQRSSQPRLSLPLAKPTETIPVEIKPVAETTPAESKAVKTKPVIETNNSGRRKPVPAAVPVLTPEEAKALIVRMDKEREEARKRGFVFYEEFFLSARNVPSQKDIQQTPNWQFVPKDDEPIGNSTAKRQGYFAVNSDTPLEYTFIEPLLEHTLYRYTICCSVKGEGKVVLSRKDGKNPQEFSVSSKIFEPIVYELGDGSTLNTKIIPVVTFSGSLEVESITIYQKPIKDQWTVCLGTIENISHVPDINKSNYPDCYYTAEFVVKDILDGKPAPQKIQLLIPAFLNNEIDPLSKTMKKGNWKVSIRPFSLASKEEQEIEQVDEIETYLLTPYILNVAETTTIPELTVSGIPILEGDAYVSPFDNPVNPPLSSKFIEDSKNEIKKELAKVKRIIEQVDNEKKVNEEFQITWNKKQAKYDSLNSTLIWAKEQNSFFALPKEWKFIPSVKMTDENIEAIVELDRLFKTQGIQFIIQIVPDYRDIAALVLNPEFQKYGDQRSARAAKELLERGVEVQYISDEIVKNAFKYERLFFYPSDFHPDEGTTDVMTSLFATRLEKFGDLVSKDLDPDLFSKEKRDTAYKDRLKWPKNVDIGSHEAGSNVQVPYVLYNKKILDQDPKSKVLVFGNSFVAAPMTKNAYISYLAPKILHVCSCRGMGGVSALTVLPQLFLSSPETYFKDKMIAVLPISITYLTDNRYSLPNVSQVDATLKSSSKSTYLADVPLKQIDKPIFSSTFNFNHSFPDYLPFRTSSVVLSNAQKQFSFSVPTDMKANTVRVSIQPLCDYGVSLMVNGKPYRLPSRYNPKWEIIDFELDNNKFFSIEMDFKNCSSPDAKVLIGNVSLFE